LKKNESNFNKNQSQGNFFENEATFNKNQSLNSQNGSWFNYNVTGKFQDLY